MKHIYTFLATLIISASMIAQSPASIKYQAVLRDARGNIKASASVHFAGELYGGGVVFWVDKTGQHGLICSMIDLSISQVWSNVSYTIIGTTAQSNLDGLSNSNAIVGLSGHTISASKLCLDYTNSDYGTGLFSDWYLPAVDQLSLLNLTIYEVNLTLDRDNNETTTKFKKEAPYYWSSTEYSAKKGCFFNYYNGIKGNFKKSDSNCVRAIRSF